MSVDLFQNFRINIQLLRIDCGLSASELSAKLEMTSKRITDLEYGKNGRGVPKAAELFKIAKIFNVSVEDLIHKKAKVILQ